MLSRVTLSLSKEPKLILKPLYEPQTKQLYSIQNARKSEQLQVKVKLLPFYVNFRSRKEIKPPTRFHKIADQYYTAILKSINFSK